jgi:hypothetical protein
LLAWLPCRLIQMVVLGLLADARRDRKQYIPVPSESTDYNLSNSHKVIFCHHLVRSVLNIC